MVALDIRDGLTLALVFLICGPAAATEHEVTEYGPILETCRASAGNAEAQAACKGRMSDNCMESQDGGFSTLGMTSCLNAEATVWDRFLNAEYKETIAWAKAADTDEAVFFPEYAKRVDALRAAQRAWIAFRDAECALAYAHWGSGSMRNIAFATCQLDMTAARAIELGAMRGQFE